MNQMNKNYWGNLEQLRKYTERAQDQFIRNNLLSDEFLGFIDKNTKPLNSLIAYYRCAAMEIETKFKVLNEQFSLEYDRNPIETIKTRIKSNESLLRKIRKKQIPLSVESIEENISDIAGVRVVCAFLDDIYMLEECLLQQDDVKLIKRKDYIANPKPSGYRSLHLIVSIPIFLQDGKKEMKVEVQLRTIAMDFWASMEHKVRYKKNIPPEACEYLTKELLECSNQSAALDEKIQGIRNYLQNL